MLLLQVPHHERTEIHTWPDEGTRILLERHHTTYFRENSRSIRPLLFIYLGSFSLLLYIDYIFMRSKYDRNTCLFNLTHLFYVSNHILDG